MQIRIVLADDHHIVRQALHALLSHESDFLIVGEAADGLQAVAMAKALNPDVQLVDLMMPGIDGIEVARQITHSSLKTAVVILSMYADEAHVLEALQNGAVGYVLKDALTVHLTQAIREAAAGRRYLSPPLSDLAIDAYMKTGSHSPDIYDTLTTREREVLHLVAEGKTNAEISRLLQISQRTAEGHRANLMKKLGLHSQAELLRFALKRGLLSKS